MRSILIAMALASAMYTPLASAFPTYVFRSMVEAAPGAFGGAAPLSLRPSIADTDEVVFAERYLSGSEVHERIRVVETLGISRIAVDEATLGLDLDFSVNPVISDDGEYVSFAATDQDGLYGVYKVDRLGSVTRIARTNDFVTGQTLVLDPDCGDGCPVSSVSINPNFDGRVLFRGVAQTSTEFVLGGTGGAVNVLGSANSIPQVHADGLLAIYSEDLNSPGSSVELTTDGTTGGTVFFNGAYRQYTDVAVSNGSGIDSSKAAIAIRSALPQSPVVLLIPQGSGGLVEAVNSDGPFSGFSDVSVNDATRLLFAADLDIPGSGLFTGPNAALDRVIGVGDVLFDKTVVAVGIQRGDALNSSGNLTFWAELDDGSQHIVRGKTFTSVLFDVYAQLSVPLGGSTGLSAVLDGPFTAVPFDLEFEVDFLAGGGTLEVELGGISLGVLRPESIPSDGLFRFAGIDPTPFLDQLRLGGELELSFLLSSPGPATIRLDDVRFLVGGAPMPFLRNGDFETGYFEGWTVNGTSGSTAFVKALAATPAPAPAALVLMGTGVLGVLLVGRRRRRLLSSTKPR